MLKSALKISIILAVGFTTSQSWAVSQSMVPMGNTVSQIKGDNSTKQSIPVDPWNFFQQGFNTLLQLDSTMTQPFFANPAPLNQFMLQENSKQFLISLNVPGVDPRKIKVSVSQGVLFIQAREESGDKAKQNESHAYFSYHMALPDNADTQKISAILKRGVLQITIEKTNKRVAMTEIPVKEIA